MIILHDEQHHTYREHAVPSLRCGGVDSVGMLMCRCAFLHNKHTLPHTCTHTDAHMRGHMLTHTCVRTQTHTHTHNDSVDGEQWRARQDRSLHAMLVREHIIA